MATSKVESFVSRKAQEPDHTPDGEAPSGGYHVPALRLVGSTELIRGRNSYDGKDKGNDNYYD